MATAIAYWILSLQCILIHASKAELIILVTGSTDGIGKTTATALANWGAEVILCRGNEKKGKRIILETSSEECDHPVVGILSKVLVVEAAIYNHETVRFSLGYPELKLIVSSVKLL